MVPVFGAYATPAGVVTREAFDAIVEHLCVGLRDVDGLDGLLLELHGAMVVEDEPDPETVLLHAVRDVVGDATPIVAVMDLHANVTPRRLELLDVLVGYRTNPHVDTYECGLRAVEHLGRLLDDGIEPHIVHASAKVLAAPIAQRTEEPPLRDLLARAAELEAEEGFLEVVVHGGYAYADVAHAGSSFSVTTTEDRLLAAETAVTELCALAWSERERFARQLRDAGDAVAEAANLADEQRATVALVDTGDNINGGSPGDGTWLLQELLARPGLRGTTTLCDPDAVARAADVGIGATVAGPFGGGSGSLSGGPVEADAVVRWVGDGIFVNTGPMAHGARVSMGRAAVVRIDDVDVILQSQPVQPNDPAMFRHVGLEPTDFDVVALKGAAAVRAGWDELVTGFVDAGTRGVTDSDLARLPYRHATDVWPLQPDVEGRARLGAGPSTPAIDG